MNDSRKWKKKLEREAAMLYLVAAIAVALTSAGMAILILAVAEYSQGTSVQLPVDDIMGAVRTAGLVLFVTTICPILAVAAVYWHKSRKD